MKVAQQVTVVKRWSSENHPSLFEDGRVATEFNDS